MADRLSDEAWLERACARFNDYFHVPGEGVQPDPLSLNGLSEYLT